MANPNIGAATNFYGRSNGLALTTSSQNITGTVPTNRVYKVNSLIIANVNGSTAADVTVTWFDTATGSNYTLAFTVTVPADATLVVLSKDTQIYLEEGDFLSVTASANSVLHATVSFEEIFA
jgi:hypothetical protein